ncbi:MAG: SWIM zinc finger family protein [Limisphaerales bacterium]
MSWFHFRPYVSVAERRAKAARAMAKMSKAGKTVSPVVLRGRQIAATFWGKAWCDNLEAYSDYANRLPRGRSYVRNGSVVDLQISEGKVTARVSGSDLYTIQIKIQPLPRGLWRSIQAECAGKIDSLLELLQGRLSASVMQIVTRPQRGLFPTPKEIDLDCSCPDWADMCKHVAAVLYGVGARLDEQPELLFKLRGIDAADLIGKVSAAEAVRQSTPADGASALSEADLADVFGIELEPRSTASTPPRSVAQPTPMAPTPAPAPESKTPSRKGAVRRLNSAARAQLAAVAKARWTKFKETQRRAAPARRKISVAARARVAAAMRARWAAKKAAANR